MKALDLSPEANWRRRFRATDIRWTFLAAQNPRRGLACTNKDGIYQLYAWDVPAGELRQVTDQPVMRSVISSACHSQAVRRRIFLRTSLPIARLCQRKTARET
jgi:hypothetical protein